MALTNPSFSTRGPAPANNFNINFGGSLQQNDVVVIVSYVNGALTINPPATWAKSWTLHSEVTGAGVTVAVLSNTYTTGDPQSITFGFSGTAAFLAVGMSWRGADVGNAIGNVVTQITPSGTSHQSPAATPFNPSEHVSIHFIGGDADSLTHAHTGPGTLGEISDQAGTGIHRAVYFGDSFPSVVAENFTTSGTDACQTVTLQINGPMGGMPGVLTGEPLTKAQMLKARDHAKAIGAKVKTKFDQRRR